MSEKTSIPVRAKARDSKGAMASKAKSGRSNGPHPVEEASRADVREDGIESWPLSRLRSHPRQDAAFHPLSEQELRQLAEDMRQHGQTTPLEVLPDGTILAGHQRRRAAERLGWAELRVRVRADLAGNPDAAERRLIEDNLARRQLDPLDKVRAAKRIVELEHGHDPGGLSGYQQHDLCEEIARQLGRSPRQVQRYLNILRAEMPIQRLCSEGKLKQNRAEQVAGLPQAVQLQIAREIEAGGRASEVLARHRAVGQVEVDVNKELDAFFRAASRAHATLAGREREVFIPSIGTDVAEYIRTLEGTERMIVALVKRLKTLNKRAADDLRRLAGEIRRRHVGSGRGKSR